MNYLNDKPYPPGDYQVKLLKIEEAQTTKGSDIIKLTLEMSGTNFKLFYNIYSF